MKLSTLATIKKYFWSIFGIMGVVFFWVGLWDGVGSLPYIEIWWVSMLTGLAMIAFSGLFLKGNNLFGGKSSPLHNLLHDIQDHPEKHLFEIRFRDKIKNRELALSGQHLKGFEKGFVVYISNGMEKFIPLHRITEVKHKGKTHWKL